MTISGYRVGYNTLDTALPADNQGRVLAGREYGLVLATCPQVKAATGREAIVLLPADLEPSGGTADPVLARFADVETNAAALGPYDRQVLADLAATVGVDVDDGPNKAELVARLAVLDPFPDLPPLEGAEPMGAARPRVERVAGPDAEPAGVNESPVPHTPAAASPGETVAHTPAGDIPPDGAQVTPDPDVADPAPSPRPAARKAASTRKAH